MTRREKRRYEKVFGDRKVYELTEEEKGAPITKKIGETCRHRLEKRWYRRLVFLNFLITFAVILTLVLNVKKNLNFFGECVGLMVDDVKTTWQEAATDVENADVEDEIDSDTDSEKENDAENIENQQDKEDEETAADKLTKKLDKDMPFEITLFFYGMMLLVVGYIGLYFYYAMYRSMSLRITEKNFPEVYHTIEEYAKRLGIRTPKAYVMGSDGVLNAFSTFLFRRQWILINAELFEVAYREYHDMDSLNFIIAHEMAHIYYGHATLHYNLPIWFTMNMPIFGAIASRAREYSCDRLAQRLTGVSGIEAMLVLVVDRHLYKMVDQEDYLSEMRSMKGFFIWLVNMFMDHPIMSKRMLALEEGRGSGKLY